MFNVDSFKNSRVLDAAAKTAGFIFKGKICKLYCIVSGGGGGGVVIIEAQFR